MELTFENFGNVGVDHSPVLAEIQIEKIKKKSFHEKIKETLAFLGALFIAGAIGYLIW